ncbi:hypothetical protein D3C75_1121100 [compost metagenome]
MPSSPINRPEATIAGMMGTKMLERVRASRWATLSLAVARSVSSALLAVPVPVSATNSA